MKTLGAAMADLRTLLRADVPLIVRRWEESVDREPWSRLSDTERLDHLPDFLSELFDSLEPGARGDNLDTSFLSTAAAHGEHRRQHGLSYDEVMEETALLRRAVWEYAQHHREHVHEMIRIDSALTFGLMASLRGYTKAELQSGGEWETTFSRFLLECARQLGSYDD